MRTINNIAIHCTATPQDTRVQSILDYWKRPVRQGGAGWKNPGYHYLVESNGVIHHLLPEDKVSNGVRGHNHDSIHISYIGGVDEKGKPKDTRTTQQIAAMFRLLVMLKAKYPGATIKGHRDFEGVSKACPSFDVGEWLKVETVNHF